MLAVDPGLRTELTEIARRVLAEHTTSGRVRELADSGSAFDAALWTRFTDLGWLGLDIADEHGGAEAGFDHLAVVLTELGHSLTGGAFFATTVLAAGAIALMGSQQQCRRWLPELAVGALRGTVALIDVDGGIKSGRVATRCDRVGSGWTLTGKSGYVLDGLGADLLIVPALDADRCVQIFAVDARETAVERASEPLLDATRDFATVEFVAAPLSEGDWLCGGDRAEQALGQLRDRAALGIAHDALGTLGRVLNETVDYARTREQFGRPIGSFQAVKHQLADLLMDQQTGAMILADADDALTRRPDHASALCSAAKFRCTDAAARGAGTGIQLHGGIGYSWEHDLHLLFKRAQLDQALYGSARWHRRRVADQLPLR